MQNRKHKKDNNISYAKKDPLPALEMILKKFEYKPRILLIEDNEDDALFTKIVLQKYFSVENAYPGDNAFKMASRNKYDLIIMDINQEKEMNNLQTAKAIRTLFGYEHTPVATVTSFNREIKIKINAEAGIGYHICKPLTKEILLNLTREMLNGILIKNH